jgi:hypothetical protein
MILLGLTTIYFLRLQVKFRVVYNVSSNNLILFNLLQFHNDFSQVNDVI